MTPPEESTKRVVRQWLDKADQDFRAGEALLSAENPFFFPTCFHAQQAAEKYLKAFLTWHQIEFPKTHAIEHLLDLLEPEFSSLAAALQEAVALTSYGVEIRYPGDQPDPNEEESREAFELARKVRDAILPLLPVSLGSD
jgi:HEPN domain-containing protein